MDFEELRDECIRRMRLRVERYGNRAELPRLDMIWVACDQSGEDTLLLCIDLHAARRQAILDRLAA